MKSRFWDNTLVELARCGMTQKELCVRTGIGETAVSNGTTRKSSPNADAAVSIARVLDVSVEYLVCGKDAEGLTPDEMELVQLYRNMDENKKAAVVGAARGIAGTEFVDAKKGASKSA